MILISIVAAMLLAVSKVNGFAVVSPTTTNQPLDLKGPVMLYYSSDMVEAVADNDATASFPTTTTANSDIANRYFQLEELEDVDACTTEIFLTNSNEVTVGSTNGPQFTTASGSWKLLTSTTFEMTISRSYSGGRQASVLSPNSIGEFSYTVDRTFVGELTTVGANLAVSGSMYITNRAQEKQHVGYFNLIDTTTARSNQQEQL